MNDRLKWINRQWRLGWGLLIAGLILALAGIAVQRLVGSLSFNPKIITGLGILFLGIGAAFMVRYGSARRSEKAALRMVNEERDERLQSLRARAGNRAYWVSAIMAYAILMWDSMSANGSLPELMGDALWYALAALVLVPFGVYAASLAYDLKQN